MINPRLLPSQTNLPTSEVIPLIPALPTGVGMIGKVDINHVPNFSILPPIFFPIELALIAAKTSARISQTEIRLTISQENRSKDPQRVKLVRSISPPHTRYFCDDPSEDIFCIPSDVVLIVVSCPPPVVVFGAKVPISVVINITAMLSANTVTTGAKMIDKILVRSKCFLIESGNLIVSLNVSASTINGDAATTSQRYPTLIISTTASASNGKKSIIANHALTNISPDILPKLSTPVSEI